MRESSRIHAHVQVGWRDVNGAWLEHFVLAGELHRETRDAIQQVRKEIRHQSVAFLNDCYRDGEVTGQTSKQCMKALYAFSRYGYDHEVEWCGARQDVPLKSRHQCERNQMIIQSGDSGFGVRVIREILDSGE